ncbi:thioredoxin family protein [Clostridium swellfunianum]|uniref:thioredoxin family protein n=1 Tax=Clostridium swellfunianum TaxID=1367462 RepID=UPI00202FB9BB|nr:thioredoxin family protein [Clostridium swellfunianum]MCM0650692.1 thioredoxin family protein [Clostridium swellfunianum]
MIMMNSSESIEELISNNEVALVYFGSVGCNVCNVMKPKVEELLKAYPKIKSAQVDIENSIELSGFYNIFTIPAILVYIEGKEIIREARHISIQELNSKIERYYNMLFE